MTAAELSRRAIVAGGFAATMVRPGAALAVSGDTIAARLPGIEVFDAGGRPVRVADLFNTDQFNPAVRDFLVAELTGSRGRVS